MAFDYANRGTGVYDQVGKCVQSKSWRVDLSVTNAATATTYDLGYLPRGAQITEAKLVIPTPVSGSGVSAATVAISVPGFGNFISGQNVFAAGLGVMNAATYVNAISANGPGTSDQKVQYTLTLTGGSTATAGVFIITVFYVV